MIHIDIAFVVSHYYTIQSTLDTFLLVCTSFYTWSNKHSITLKTHFCLLMASVNDTLSKHSTHKSNMFLHQLKAYLRTSGKSMSEIIPGQLYLGNWENSILLDHKITHVVNMTREIPNFHKSRSNITYLNLTLTDSEEQLIYDYIPIVIEFMRGAIERGGIVFVHCVAGMSRSASMVIAYLMKRNGWSYETSLKFVVERRKIVKPNKGFEIALKRFEQHCASE